MFVLDSPGYLILLLAPLILAALWFWRQGLAMAMAARCLALILLVVALAQPEWRQPSSTSELGLILDTSNSITAADRAIEANWLQTAAAHASASSPVIAITFAGSAAALTIRAPLSPAQITQVLTTRGDASATDLAGALRLAAGLVPPGTRLVLLTDGEQTVG
ncbi:MAG TPA: hypothetical protein VN837_06720, partial [Chloroflexota bacterium]|nr:hypothetical protein [Chloroflexota bacterium]